MGAGLAKLFAPDLKRKLSEQQWEYIAFGPYPHWTLTRRALVKRGIYEVGGRTLTFVGEAVRALVLADLPRPELAQGTEAQRAETSSGSVHDGPVRVSECAHPQPEDT